MISVKALTLVSECGFIWKDEVIPCLDFRIYWAFKPMTDDHIKRGEDRRDTRKGCVRTEANWRDAASSQ